MELYWRVFLHAKVAYIKKLLAHDAELYRYMFLTLNLESDSIFLGQCLRAATLERMAHEL